MIINRKQPIEIPVKKWLTLLGKPFFRVFCFIGTCLVLITAVLFVYRMNPFGNPLVPGCSFYRLTGLFCPACGMTRAMHHVLHGRFAQAFSLNVLWPAIVLFLSASLGLWFFWLITGKNPLHKANWFLRLYPAVTWVIVISLFAFWVLRNIPVYPFTWLAP